MCDRCKTFGGYGARKYYCPEYFDHFKYCPYCGAKLNASNEKYSNTYWDWVNSLEEYSDEWRAAVKVGESYCKAGKDLDMYLDEIKEKVKHML